MDHIITEHNYQNFINPTIGGERKSSGLVPRDFQSFRPGCNAAVPMFSDADILPENEWQGRLDQQIGDKASLYDVREYKYDLLKSLDQDGIGICWAFSTTKSMMYTRYTMGVEAVLSAWWVAGKVKGWRDQGGWCNQSLDEIVKEGVPLMSLCPSYSSKYDTAATRADAATRKATEWWDGSDSREQNRRIMITAFLLGFAPVLDFNFIGHSMCGCRLVSLNPLTIDCDNSWGESSGNKGLYRIVGNNAIPDNIVVPRVQSAAA